MQIIFFQITDSVCPSKYSHGQSRNNCHCNFTNIYTKQIWLILPFLQVSVFTGGANCRMLRNKIISTFRF